MFSVIIVVFFFYVLQKQVGVLLTPPTGKQRADEWRGLESERQLQIKVEDVQRCIIHMSTAVAIFPYN